MTYVRKKWIACNFKYFLRLFLLATLLISRTPRQFLEKREVENKKERDPCGGREIKRVYCPKKKCSK